MRLFVHRLVVKTSLMVCPWRPVADAERRTVASWSRGLAGPQKDSIPFRKLREQFAVYNKTAGKSALASPKLPQEKQTPSGRRVRTHEGWLTWQSVAPDTSLGLVRVPFWRAR